MFRHQIARLPFSLYSSQKRTIFSNFRKILARSKIKNREALNESDNEEIVTPQSEKNNNQNNNQNINKNNQDQKPETQKDPKSQQPTDTNIEKNQKAKDTANNNDPKNITKAEGQSNTNFVLKEEQSYSVQPFQFFKKQNEEETRRDPLFPAFSQLDQDIIYSHTNYSLHQQLYSPYRWTPLIQKVQPSVEFHEKMYQFRKVRGWDENHTKELVDTMLFEALKGTDYDYYYDYKCHPTKHCKFHGVADFLIYKKSGDHLPLIPVFIAKKKYNPLVNKKMEEYNVCEAVGASAWAFANMLAVNKDIQKTRILQTTGHTWVMYEFSREGEFRKTGVYRPNTPGVYKKIYDDPEMQEVMLGIIRYASFIHSENEIGLQKAYDFIDEVKYLEELNDEEREKLEKRRRFWRFLPRKVTDLFFYK